MRVGRGFTLVETVLVVAMIGIGASVAFAAASEQVSAARARSDEQGIRLRVRDERRIARERLLAMRVSVLAADPQTLVFERAQVVTNRLGKRTCEPTGDVLAQVRFAHAKLVPSSNANDLCQDERGLPIGSPELTIARVTRAFGFIFDNATNTTGLGGGPTI